MTVINVRLVSRSEALALLLLDMQTLLSYRYESKDKLQRTVSIVISNYTFSVNRNRTKIMTIGRQGEIFSTSVAGENI